MRVLTVARFGPLLAIACTAPHRALPQRAPVVSRVEPWPAADALFHRDPRWLGADAAFSVHLGGERVLWLFGDTFVATGERCTRREAKMVRNTIALQSGRDPSCARIEFCWQPGPASWLPERGEHWFWPQHGIRLANGPLVLFWTRVRPSGGGVFGFHADGWRAIRIDNPDELPTDWRLRDLDLPPTPAGLVFAQGCTLHGAHVYGLAIREPGDHAGHLWRIARAALARGDLAALELWCGSWQPLRAEATPTAVLADAAPESSLHFDAASARWLHVRSLGFGATTLAVAYAPEPTGPWSSPESFARPPESDRARPFVYAGKAHPELLGADLVVTYAANSFDFGELVADDTLYWPRFIRATLQRGR